MPAGFYKKLLSHPFFIGLIIIILILVSTPPWFTKFRIREVERHLVNGNAIYFYEDLDFDQVSEKILFDLNHKGIIKIQLFQKNSIINQHNINTAPVDGRFFFFGDFDKNNNKELFIYTIRNDSVFLNILDLMSDNPNKLNSRFIDCANNPNSLDHPEITYITAYDMNHDHMDELIFCINTGFSKQPRNVYIYDILNNTLLKSPKSGAAVAHLSLSDINRDSIPELVFGSFAPGNLDINFPYSDQYGWLMALNANLKFVFKPVLFPQYPCKVAVIPIKIKNTTRIVALNDYFGDGPYFSTLGLYNQYGSRLNEIRLEAFSKGNLHILPAKNGLFYLLGNQPGKIELRDTAFRILKLINVPDITSAIPVAIINADLNGKCEYLFSGDRKGLYYIADENLQSFTAIQTRSEFNGLPQFMSVVQNKDNPLLLYLPLLNEDLLLRYSHNRLYQIRFVIILIVYLTISSAIYLLYTILKYRARLQYETTRKITELQLRSVKNQMDPHFTFNVLNSIGSLYSSSKNHESADYLFGKYSRLLREVVINYNETEVTLEKELDFVRNYLDIEKFRMEGRFEYILHVDEQVNLLTMIPRMLIHTFAENSIKYGIRQIEYQGFMEIFISLLQNGLHIRITDNGPGLKSIPKNEVGGTGKGLLIVDEMIGLFYELKRVKINYSIQNLTEQGTVRGTVAEILIGSAG